MNYCIVQNANSNRVIKCLKRVVEQLDVPFSSHLHLEVFSIQNIQTTSKQILTTQAVDGFVADIFRLYPWLM
jgi:hypothetical protein